MDACQDPKNTDDELNVAAVVVKQFSDQLVQQAKEKNELPIEFTNSTGTYIEHLNDDCLLQIFSVQSLSLIDLCCLAETCTLFHRITQRVFPKDLTISFRYNCHDVAARKYSPSRDRTSQDIETIFKNFGSCLSEVSMSQPPLSRIKTEEPIVFVLCLLSEYCVESLDSLTIESMKNLAVVTVNLKPIFKRLQILDLHRVDVWADKTLFADLDSLIELRVRFVGNDIDILENIFPKLERFIFHGYEFQIDHPLLTFISRHRSLKMLHLKIFIDDKFEMNFLQVIGNSCMELEELDFDIGPTNASSLQPLQALQSLKTLKLRRVTRGYLKLCALLTNLRELHLVVCDLPTDLNQFDALAQLTKLKITSGDFTSDFLDVVGIIRRLTNLEELTISNVGLPGFLLNEETFSRIVNVVKGRSNVLTLECKCNFVLENSDEDQKVRLLPE